jgi:hypothetical protein
VLLLAPVAAIMAAVFAGEPGLAHWTQTFMASAARFVMQFPTRSLVRQVYGTMEISVALVHLWTSGNRDGRLTRR